MNSPGSPAKFRVPLKIGVGVYSQPADAHTKWTANQDLW